MRHWIHGSIGAALIAASWGCGSDDQGNGATTGGDGGGGTGGEAAGGGGDGPGAGGGGGEDGTQSGPCTLVARGQEVSTGKAITPAITWTGSAFVIVWRETGADEGDIHLAAIGPDGAKLGQEVIDDGPSASSHPTVVRDGQGLLVLWQDLDGTGSVVRGRRASLEGVPEGDAFDVATSGAAESWPNAAAGPDGALVTWMDAGKSMVGSLSGEALGSSAPVDLAQFPSLAAEGEQAALAWSQGDALGFARLDQGIDAIEPILHQGVDAKVSRVALGGSDAFLAWEDTRSGMEQIRAVRISSQGEVSGELTLSPGELSANWPALAWTDRGLAVAYYQFREGPADVFFTLVNQDFTLADVDLEVSSGGEAAARYPALAWTGQEIGVAYAETDQGIRLSRVRCK